MEKMIAWVEIPTTDFERGVTFYQDLLGIELKSEVSEQEKMACFPSGEGAIIHSPGFEPSGQGVVVSFNAGKNLDRMLLKIKNLGGEIVRSKTKIEAEEMGYFALFVDSEGNRIGLYGQ
jgi:predicted enzyme related to lactoylglutathione lyase